MARIAKPQVLAPEQAVIRLTTILDEPRNEIRLRSIYERFPSHEDRLPRLLALAQERGVSPNQLASYGG